VLLAIGRRGTPRQLGVSGESKEKVVYQFIDPEQYREKHVLVVGGGDSALEAAATIADLPGATVTLSYRGEVFSRAREKNRAKVDDMSRNGKIKVLMNSVVNVIADDTMTIAHQGRTVTLPNAAVIICAGGVLPTEFLQKIGTSMETKYGTA
jgi:thioredoxin reductase